ncbi:hypothetical protein AGMMS50293_13720 [Spirochaetia bacterium]|nr:hypothetical protein AGMMS50293_13720 [Spirochaetia bacterium]
MGGHDAGDAASSFLTEKIPAAPHPLDRESLERHIIAVHEALLSFAKERGSPNMGSTLAGILLQEGESAWYNLGDSRVYRLRRGYLSQLSNDDSLAAIAPGSPSNIITNAMGAGLASVFVQSRFSPSLAVSGDVFLMCSDGVHGVIDDDTLETMLGAKTEPEETARKRRYEQVSFFNITHLGGQIVKCGFALGGCHGGAGGFVFGFVEGFFRNVYQAF